MLSHTLLLLHHGRSSCLAIGSGHLHIHIVVAERTVCRLLHIWSADSWGCGLHSQAGWSCHRRRSTHHPALRHEAHLGSNHRRGAWLPNGANASRWSQRGSYACERNRRGGSWELLGPDLCLLHRLLHRRHLRWPIRGCHLLRLMLLHQLCRFIF